MYVNQNDDQCKTEQQDDLYTCGECQSKLKTFCQLFQHLASHGSRTYRYLFDDIVKIGYLRHETADCSTQTTLDEDEKSYSLHDNPILLPVNHSSDSYSVVKTDGKIQVICQTAVQRKFTKKQPKTLFDSHTGNSLSLKDSQPSDKRKFTRKETCLNKEGSHDSKRMQVLREENNTEMMTINTEEKPIKLRRLKYKTWIPPSTVNSDQNLLNTDQNSSNITQNNDSGIKLHEDEMPKPDPNSGGITSNYNEISSNKSLPPNNTNSKDVLSLSKKKKKTLNQSTVCDKCGHVCSSRKALHGHVKEQHQSPEQMKSCPQCDKKFPTNSKLNQHLIVHNGVKSISCDICGKKFSRRNTMKAHVKFMHRRNQDKLLTCPQCDKSFMYPSSYKQHVQAHEANFNCGVCEMVFNRCSSLKRHEMMHSGKVAHNCGICGHKFIQKSAYWIHMEKHHDLTKSKLHAQQLTPTLIESSLGSSGPDV